MNRIVRGLLLPLVLATGVLAACGDDDDDGGQQPPPQTPTFTVRIAHLTGGQETPAVATTAFGAGALAVDEATGKVRGFVVTSGTPTANQAHVHLAARGTPGGIIVPMTGGPDVWVVPDDATPLTPEQRTAFTAGNLYFNVHTPANQSGEIRGQLDKAGTVRITTLDQAQEVPTPGSTGAFGAGMLSVDAATGAVAGFVITNGTPTANQAHVHEQARGTAGPVRVPLTGGPSLWVVPDNATPLTAELRTAFTNGTLYYNVHTPANQSGEIRGQLDKQGTVRFASLNGAQETPAVTTTAVAAGPLSVDAATGNVTGFVVTNGTPTANQAHVHEQARGTAGPIRVPLTGGPALWVVPDNATPLTTELRTAFTNGTLYYNVHTPANQSGEIRGQLD